MSFPLLKLLIGICIGILVVQSNYVAQMDFGFWDWVQKPSSIGIQQRPAKCVFEQSRL